MSAPLVVIPSVPMHRTGDQAFLDIKAAEGLMLYARLWPGPVRALFRPGTRGQIAYGHAYRIDELPFEIATLDGEFADHRALLDDAGVILAAADNHHDFVLPTITSTPVAYVIEYTLGTRLRIVHLDRGMTFAGLRSAAWTLGMEAARRRAMRRAAGLQANGTPAFDAYRGLSGKALLYFDNRIGEAQQPDAAELVAKEARLRSGAPLRLAFSGRLERMKGADHLVPVLRNLAQVGIPFRFDIYGSGSLEPMMRQDASAAGLAEQIRFHGPVPFDEELVPALKRDIDLFVCCHRQSDPSCTYIESMACGVPIVGYANAAFAGVLRLGAAGIATPMDRPAEVAASIMALHEDRKRLAAMARLAAEIGRQHSFEQVFAQRIDHLRSIAQV